jgi:Mg2+/Co2+ transporter CorB
VQNLLILKIFITIYFLSGYEHYLIPVKKKRMKSMKKKNKKEASLI